MNQPLRVAIAGLGTVGGGVVKALLARRSELAERAGRTLDIVAISARDKAKSRGLEITQFDWHGDAVSLATSNSDVVVELIGGEEGAARAVVEASLKAGKHVVTGNKALLAKYGASLAALAESKKVALKFEAAVAGGIPIVKALRESLIAYGVAAVRGILNGTCNYILTQMEATGRDFADVLKDAQKLGYAEADPTLDVGGGDTAHKLALLSSLAFGTVPDLAAIEVDGIQRITPDDIRFAREFGFRIKLLGIARHTEGGIVQRVEPAMVRAGTPIADVDGAFNAVMADSGEAGHFFFEGRGAGEAPTASAVIADLVDIARGNIGLAFGRPAALLKPLVAATAGAAPSAFYLRFDVLDVPGVLAEIAGHLAESRVSIESMIQRGRAPGETVSIVMITHETPRAQVERALMAIGRSDKVRARPCMIPMEAA
jgi:homoserine dehydrogenase